jgi:hypothetical protein
LELRDSMGEAERAHGGYGAAQRVACDCNALDVKQVDGFGDGFDAHGFERGPAFAEAGMAPGAGDLFVRDGVTSEVGVDVLEICVHLGAAEDDIQDFLHRVMQQNKACMETPSWVK